MRSGGGAEATLLAAPRGAEPLAVGSAIICGIELPPAVATSLRLPVGAAISCTAMDAMARERGKASVSSEGGYG